MTTRLEKTLKREILIRGRPFVIALSPEGLKLTLKGRRKGQELRWNDLVSGDAALAVALNASLGQFSAADSAQAATRSSSNPPIAAHSPSIATRRSAPTATRRSPPIATRRSPPLTATRRSPPARAKRPKRAQRLR